MTDTPDHDATADGPPAEFFDGEPTGSGTATAILTDVTALIDLSEHSALTSTRERAAAAGVTASATLCSMLRWVATTLQAKHVVEVGTSGGTTGLALLDGMPLKGVLTTIDDDGHRHGLAVQAYEMAGVTSSVRAVRGAAAEVLDRLSDGGYDLLVVTDAALSAADQLDHAHRLLRDGGILVVALPGQAAHDFATAVVSDDRFVVTLQQTPAGEVMALATKLPTED